MDYYNTLVSLAKLASENSKNEYSIIDYAFGFVPVKNGENKVKEVGNDFFKISHWLLNEMETSNGES